MPPPRARHTEAVVSGDRFFLSAENLVSDNPADFARTSQAAMSIAAIAIPVNPCGPSNRKRAWLLRQSQRRDGIPLDQRLQGFDEVCYRPKGNRRIAEHVRAANQPLVGLQVQENERADSTTPPAVGCGRANGTFTGMARTLRTLGGEESTNYSLIFIRGGEFDGLTKRKNRKVSATPRGRTDLYLKCATRLFRRSIELPRSDAYTVTAVSPVLH